MAEALRVEFALDPDVLWVGGGEVVRSGSVDFQGFRPELGEVRTGTMSIVVSNQDREFDPDNPSSALVLVGYFDVGVYVRLVLTHAAVDYVVYTGIIDRITQGYDIGGRDAIATIEATDDRLVQRPLPSGYQEAVGRIGADERYLPLDDPIEQNYPRDPFRPEGSTAVWGGPVRQVSQTAPSCPGGVTISSQGSVLGLPAFMADGAGDWHLSMMLGCPRLTLTVGQSTMVLNSIDSEYVRVIYAANNSSGTLTPAITLLQGPTGAEAARVWLAPNDGAVHHYYWEVDAGTGAQLWIDGASATQHFDLNPGNWSAPPTTQVHYIGASAYAAFPEVDIQVGHFVQGPGRPGAGPELARVAANGAVTAGVSYDTPTQRVQWVLDQAGVTAGDISSTSTQLIGVSGGDLPAEHLRKVAAADGGFFWIDAEGLGQYRSPAAGGLRDVFRDDSPTQGYTGLVPVRDRARRLTAAVATVAGVEVARYDTGRVPVRELSFETLNLVPADAYDRCLDLVQERMDVGTVYPSLSFMPERDGRWPLALTLDLLEYIEVVRTPVGVGATVDVAARVEGISHSFGAHPSTWVTTLALGVPTPSGFFVLDSSQLDTGRLA